jgi:hypothetical protein
MDNAEGHKRGERCFEGITTIHKSAVESTISHKGVNNGRSTTKGDGDGAM